MKSKSTKVTQQEASKCSYSSADQWEQYEARSNGIIHISSSTTLQDQVTFLFYFFLKLNLTLFLEIEHLSAQLF